MNIFSRLDNLTDLTTNEQTLVDYMKNNPERFINMSADEISAACFISIPTIYRLCKKLELNGLAQLKVMVSTSIRDYLKEKKTIDYNYPFSQNETQYQITMKMKELFDRGEFVVSAEVGPPKGIHVDELVEEAKTYLKDVHAVNVTDNQSSVMRLGSLAMCKVLKDAGMNPIFQLACRDRNRIALESDLLSAAMLGIDNILCLTGDHTKMGDHPQAKPVFDLDSVSLLHTVKLLESGVDLGGNELVGEPPKFSKGAVVSPCSDSVDAQLAKMERKVAAGAEYFQTQAVFEPEKFIKFMEKAKQFGKPVQVGIIIPKSAGMAKFMNNNVAGIHVPDEMLEELKADKEKTKAGITGVEIAARIIKECKPYCQGVHIMALGWESKIPDLLKLAEI